ncbi:MAG: FixH family protein, partial [Flavobacteriales bacterium]|nr:FixH family protein [Flavobacteriales bacterium]
FMTGFVLLMTSFMIRAASNQEELVAENYYEQELAYQQQIDKLNRSAALSEDLTLTSTEAGLSLQFPAWTQGKAVTGSVQLQRPSDQRADDQLLDADRHMLIPTSDRLKGAYNVVVEWSVEGVSYLHRDRIYVP